MRFCIIAFLMVVFCAGCSRKDVFDSWCSDVTPILRQEGISFDDRYEEVLRLAKRYGLYELGTETATNVVKYKHYKEMVQMWQAIGNAPPSAKRRLWQDTARDVRGSEWDCEPFLAWTGGYTNDKAMLIRECEQRSHRACSTLAFLEEDKEKAKHYRALSNKYWEFKYGDKDLKRASRKGTKEATNATKQAATEYCMKREHSLLSVYQDLHLPRGKGKQDKKDGITLIVTKSKTYVDDRLVDDNEKLQAQKGYLLKEIHEALLARRGKKNTDVLFILADVNTSTAFLARLLYASRFAEFKTGKIFVDETTGDCLKVSHIECRFAKQDGLDEVNLTRHATLGQVVDAIAKQGKSEVFLKFPSSQKKVNEGLGTLFEKNRGR